MRRVQTALASVALTLGFASAAFGACQLRQTDAYQVLMDGDRAVVDGAIDGKPIRLEVDTGASSTLLFPQAAAAMGLKTFEVEDQKEYGAGVRAERTAVGEFRLGGRAARHIDLLVNDAGPRSQGHAGLVGEDLLGQGDLELDFAGGAVRLFRPKDCVGEQVAYWAEGYEVTPLAPAPSSGGVQLYVMLNGRRILAEIDSGAATSIVTTGAAQVAGVTATSERGRDIGPRRGQGPGQIFVAVFPTFSIGDETIKNAKFVVADLSADGADPVLGSRLGASAIGAPQMLLGADFIRAHRIYVARSQNKLYFSYNGGPVFQVQGPP